MAIYSTVHLENKLEISTIPFILPCDEQEVVLVVLAQVSRVQPALLVQGLLSLFWLIQVAHEHMTPPETDLTIPILVWLVQLGLAANHHLSTAEDNIMISILHMVRPKSKKDY